MEELKCSTSRWNGSISYYNISEVGYYWERCAYEFFREGEWEKIGSTSIIIHMIGLSSTLIKRVNDYITEENLSFKWRLEMDQLKNFYIELISLKQELKEIVNTNRLKDLLQVQKRAVELKSQIDGSEIYAKYLHHKDIMECRLRNSNEDKLPGTQMLQKSDISMIEEELAIIEKSTRIDNSFELELDTKIDLEETKSECIEIVSNIKCQYDKEINELKAELVKYSDKLWGISYDEFSTIYNEFMDKDITLDNDSSIQISFNDKNSIELLQKLSEFNLPALKSYKFDYIPEDLNVIKDFLKYSMPTQYKFWFNHTSDMQIDGSKYIEALKAAAKKTITNFSVRSTRLSSQEVSELIYSAKGVNSIYLQYCTLSLDSKLDFGSKMDGCKIKTIYMDYSGNSSHSNWGTNPTGFENFIAGISRCTPLTNSLEMLNISFCDITKDDAQNILNKYELNGIQLEGF